MIVVPSKEWKRIEVVLGVRNLKEISQDISGFIV